MACILGSSPKLKNEGNFIGQGDEEFEMVIKIHFIIFVGHKSFCYYFCWRHT